MTIVWANMVAVECEVPSGFVDGLNERHERRREVKESAKVLEELDCINPDEEVAGRADYETLRSSRVEMSNLRCALDELERSSKQLDM